MAASKRVHPLRSWYIGVAIIVIADLWIAYRMFATGCPAPGLIEAGVLIVIPSVYLALMYVTLKYD